MKKVLELFSHAFVINLDKNQDRMSLMARRLAKLGIDFERLAGIQFECATWRTAVRGCTMTHLEAVKIAQARNLESVLIMEDDAIFRPDFLMLWSILLPQLQNLSYDIFYGYDWRNNSTSASDLRIIPIESTLCNHFWAIHSRFYGSFIEACILNEQKDNPHPTDRIFTSQYARIYAPTYNLVGQDEGVSDIVNKKKELRWSA
jgi:hypothetical protein